MNAQTSTQPLSLSKYAQLVKQQQAQEKNNTNNTLESIILKIKQLKQK